MVLVAPRYLWLHGACPYALNLTVKYLLCTLLLWLHGTCGSFVSQHVPVLGLTVKYLLYTWLLMPIHGNCYHSNYVQIFPIFYYLFFCFYFPDVWLLGFRLVVAPWYLWFLSTCGTCILVVPWYLWFHGTCDCMVLVAPWYLSTCTRFNCKVPSVYSAVNAH